MTIEVKQSAALQPWSEQYDHEARPRFDIAERTGYWFQAEGETKVQWHAETCRPADIYIFAWHGGTGDTADQRNPAGWDFYLCDTRQLPRSVKTIGLATLMGENSPCGTGYQPCGIEEVANVLAGIAAKITVPRQKAP